MNVLDRIDATLKLNDDEKMLVDSVRALARDEIMPRADHYDERA